MKRLQTLAMSALVILGAASVNAAHKDVIENEFKDGCTHAKLMPTVKAFNEWAEPYGYQAEIFVPVQSSNQETFYWVGTSADFATFGKAFDAWLAGIDDGSTPAKLAADFDACTTNVSRQGFMTY